MMKKIPAMKFDIEHIKGFIKKTSIYTGIYIGSDSVIPKRVKNKKGFWQIRYVTAVIVHYDSCRGGKIFHEVRHDITNYRPKMKERLLTEVRYSVDCALMLVDSIGDRNFEVHLDINPNPTTGSAVAIKEAISWVISQGLTVKVKPHAFAASAVADNIVKKAS